MLSKRRSKLSQNTAQQSFLFKSDGKGTSVQLYLSQYLTNLMHKILFYNKFISCLYMFRAPCIHHQEVKIVLYSLCYHHTYRWPSGAQVG